jgi:hypothetical protein
MRITARIYFSGKDSNLASNYQTTQYSPRSATRSPSMLRAAQPLCVQIVVCPLPPSSPRERAKIDPPARPPHHAAPHPSPQRSTGFRANFSHSFTVSKLFPLFKHDEAAAAPSPHEEFRVHIRIYFSGKMAGEEFNPPARPPHHAAPHSSPQRSTGLRANF